jgi:hypothetical protein
MLYPSLFALLAVLSERSTKKADLFSKRSAKIECLVEITKQFF